MAPPLSVGRGRVKIFKKGGLDRTSTLSGVAGKEWGNFFQGVAILTKKLN